MIVYALLDGPSVTGAYRFDMTRGAGVLMDIEHTLHLRKDVTRLGVAPLTTMYWYSETAKDTGIDWRPEVHDSDGLSLWTGSGERLWRALNNPDRTTASAFADQSPKGYGTIQRDRVFDHYIDGVYYDKRPSVWVEPQGDWGKGSVQLVEIPTDDEIHDNVVAMWVPAEPATGWQVLRVQVSYALARRGTVPAAARQMCRDTARSGRPARPALDRRICASSWWSSWADPLDSLPFGVTPEPTVWTSRGEFGPYRPYRGRAGRGERALANPVRPDGRGHRPGRIALQLSGWATAF